jgi:regulator of nonsense transcripts 2
MFSKLKDLSKKKFKAQIRVGKVVEDLEIEFNELSALFESFHTAAVALAEFFKIHLPEFRPEDLDYKPQDGDQVIISKETSIWINDEERRFYETIPEIPSDLIESNKDSKAEEMNEFLIKLETCLTIKDIDEVVLDFWTLKLNNKATRNRLIKHFTTSRDVGKAKIYARFLKSNEEYLGDIINEVIAYLDQGFRSQIYHNNVNFRNIVFFCELIKFKLIPEHVTFHKIRSLILSLTTPNNIEILSIFFEFCGKFLLREHERLMQEMLVLLESKRKNDKLTINNKMAISNLLLLLNPPSVKSLQERKKLRPEQAFLKILIRKELNLNNDSSIRKILNAVDYNDSDLFNTMVSLFTKPDKVNYENIVPLSNILKNLNSNFKILVVDTVLEQIIQGMEAADYRLNRIRMAQCKYIAEIYEHKIIGVSVLHDLIYKILTYGHPNNHPTWNKPSGLDRPDDYFRVQMVCIILDNVNFRKTSYQSKLTVLLKFFDYYIWLKEHPIPKNFEFQTIRVFEKYKFDRANDLKEAVERLSEVVQSRNASTGSISKEVSGNNNEVDEEDDDDDDDDDDEDEDEDDEDEDEDEDIGDVDGDIKPIKDQSIEGVTSDKDDEVVAKLSYEAYERKLQEEEERKLEERLEKEFKRVVAESVNSQRGAKASNMELPQTFQDLQENMDKDGNVATPKKIIPNAKGTIPFTLVTKKGKMIATKNLALPSNVRFASTIVEEGRKQREQKKLINKFILSSNFDD